ncbi:MAG TPA: hypothetical protein VGR15_06390 [Bacteroidota bacterium]|nr:hypothetical protein [Bacteroidota bacterium]
MKTAGAVLFWLFLFLPTVCPCQQQSITQFFPLADSMAYFPPIDQKRVILCQKRVDSWYVSFVGMRTESKVLLAVVTPKKLLSPDSISMTVAFNGYVPNTGKVPTWGYVYDRNADGNIDYMALVGGAAPFKPDDFPDFFPRRKEYLMREHLEYVIRNSKLIFNHWADDNYDGILDAVVHIEMDSVRDWVEQRLVIRSTNFDSTFDDAWAFYNSMNEQHGEVSVSANRIPFHSLEKPNDFMTWKRFQDKTGVLQLLNRAAKACQLTPESFSHPENRE